MLGLGDLREATMPSWSFVTNYGAVLAVVAQSPMITAKEIASRIGVTERTVLRIIGDLEAEGFVQRTREGRVNRYQVNPDVSLRRPGMPNIAAGDLIRALMSPPGDGSRPPGSTDPL
jgi:DNA-binding transcriptional ArsR family regulator